MLSENKVKPFGISFESQFYSLTFLSMQLHFNCSYMISGSAHSSNFTHNFQPATEVTSMEKSIGNTQLTDWVRSYTKDLYAWAFQKTGDPQLSEDLVQDTFLVAAERLDAFKKESQPKTWLFGILKNKIAGHYRKVLQQNKPVSLPNEDFSAFFQANGRWEKNAAPKAWPAESGPLTNLPTFNKVFEACIENLPAMMNACIRLRFLNEVKGAQICQELGISNTNYWQLIHRAKLHLRNCLEKNWFRKE